MKHFNAALLSSLQGLALDPEDLIGKQLMARVRSMNISNVDLMRVDLF